MRRRNSLILRERSKRYELLLDTRRSTAAAGHQDDQAFNGVLEMAEREKVYIRDAAYMVAIGRVVKAMELRGLL